MMGCSFSDRLIVAAKQANQMLAYVLPMVAAMTVGECFIPLSDVAPGQEDSNDEDGKVKSKWVKAMMVPL